MRCSPEAREGPAPRGCTPHGAGRVLTVLESRQTGVWSRRVCRWLRQACVLSRQMILVSRRALFESRQKVLVSRLACFESR
jgi:hypothetical protein